MVVHQRENKWNGIEVETFSHAQAWNPKTMCYLRLCKYGVYFNFYLIKNSKNTWKIERNSIWTFKVEHEEMMQGVESTIDKQVYTLNESLMNFLRRQLET